MSTVSWTAGASPAETVDAYAPSPARAPALQEAPRL